MSIKINSKIVSEKKNPFIIAEMSGNHNQSLSVALKIVKGVAEAGADAIKLQTYTADTMTLNSNHKNLIIKNKKSPWHNKNLYKLYKKGSTPWKWHKKIFSLSRKLGLTAFSTPFDKTSVEFLEKLKVPLYKIASFEITDLPLIKKVARTKKPMIISTGMASINEIRDAVKIAKKNGCKKIILLKCTSSYPSSLNEMNLKTLKELKKKFNCEVGLSDHTKGFTSAITSVALGASVIEKHVKLNKKKSIDDSFSLDMVQFKEFVKKIRLAKKTLGKVYFGPTKSERKNLKYRRSIVAVSNIKIGEKFNENNIKCLRGIPGIKPKYYFRILGKISKKNITLGTPINLSFVK